MGNYLSNSKNEPAGQTGVSEKEGTQELVDQVDVEPKCELEKVDQEGSQEVVDRAAVKPKCDQEPEPTDAEECTREEVEPETFLEQSRVQDLIASVLQKDAIGRVEIKFLGSISPASEYYNWASYYLGDALVAEGPLSMSREEWRDLAAILELDCRAPPDFVTQKAPHLIVRSDVIVLDSINSYYLPRKLFAKSFAAAIRGQVLLPLFGYPAAEVKPSPQIDHSSDSTE